MSLPEFVYITPTAISVDGETRDCSGVYKQVAELLSACALSYENTFKSSFLGSHKEKFFESYTGIFGKYRDEEIAKTNKNRYDEGYTKAYQIVFAEAKQRGAQVAYQNGFEDGKVKGYDENILDERTAQFEKGKEAVASFFKSNGVVRLAKGQNLFVKTTNPKGLIQGSEFKMGAKLINFGQVSSQVGDVVAQVIEHSGNISFESKREIIKGVPAQVKASLFNIFKSRISEDAMPGAKFNVTVKLSYPGDSVDGVESELATFIGKVVVNPEIKSALSFDREVKWRKWKPWPIKWKYRSHHVNVNLTGLRNNVPGKYKVTLEAISGAKYVNVETKSLEVAAPAKGATKVAGLRYKFKAKAKDKKISFRVKVFYGSELLKTETVNIKSK
jgi:hypothetical protein